MGDSGLGDSGIRVLGDSGIRESGEKSLEFFSISCFISHLYYKDIIIYHTQRLISIEEINGAGSSAL